MNLGLGCSQSRIYHGRVRGRGKSNNNNRKGNNQKIPFSNLSCPKCWRRFTIAELRSEEVILAKDGRPVHWSCIMPQYVQQLKSVGVSLSQYSTPQLFRKSLIETTKKILHKSFEEVGDQLSVIQLVAQKVNVSIDILTLMAKQRQGLSP